MRLYRISWLLLILSSAPLVLVAKEGVEKRVSEEWQSDVTRLNNEIRQLKDEYRRAHDKSKGYKEEAGWIHFRDHDRYRYLMNLSNNEEKRADDARVKAESRIKQRDRILTEHDQRAPKEQTPWQTARS
jgi:hypothetical protein